mgnify:CR=1 FL=1
MIKVSDYIAKRLKEVYNIEHFFMVSGGGAMHLNDSLGRYIPNYIANHHEQACAIAAEGYARVNQRLAVVNVTTGPGGLNCLNGVFGQWTDSVPVLYVSGQVKFSTTIASCPDVPLRQLGDQEVDIISVVKPLTKYAKMVTEPKEIKYHLDRAIYEATTGRMGPVWLDIPMNVQAAMIEEYELEEFALDCGRGQGEFGIAPSPLAGEGWGEGLHHRYYAPYIKEFIRTLRKEQTPQEKKMWDILRNSNLGVKFRRQYSIDNKYIADFICLEKRLIIEVDGGQHLKSFNDTIRTFYLEKENFRLIRFWNNDIENNLDGCYEVILNELNNPHPPLNTPHPNPLPQGEREQCYSLQPLIEQLTSAKRPLIIAGHGIRLSKQEETFYKLLEKLNIPVVTTFNGFDILEDEHPCYVGRIGTIGQRAGNFALQNADLILCLGTRNNIRQASYNYENYAKNAFKIVVDIDQSELDKPTVVPDMKICADLKDFLPELLDYINCHPEFISGSIQNTNADKMLIQVQHGVSSFNWLVWCKNLKEKFSLKNFKEYEQDEKTIDPYIFTNELSKAMSENDIFVMANGSACVCAFQTAEIKKGQRFILNSGDASMGFDLPAAIGASLEAKGRNVICFAGDGSIMMNLQELQTIKHNNLPIKIFVIANEGYASIKQTQKNFFEGHMTGSGSDSGVSVPDFVEIGKAFRFKTERISKPYEVQEKIAKVLASKEPIICEVVVKSDYGFSPKLSARKLDDGTMVSPSLEDMFPFLTREEYEENMIEIH